MPIGVPKVPYRIPGDEEATWVDLYNVMYRERTLFLGQEIRCEITNHITGLMVYLSIEDGISDIFLFINSPGGWLISGMAIFDTMQTVTPDIYTICLGIAASMAPFIRLGGEPTKRCRRWQTAKSLHIGSFFCFLLNPTIFTANIYDIYRYISQAFISHISST